ncbi:YicC family protein [Peptoniphilus sp. MSJ-1]|uniref:YicC family protein n=1 Tax=Peptoniphilus ovalis TaxID=2841503 RepID=A0ABS6FG23_9FIRM|nr:YicC/YloC family endoribonuclease [Peptoniphilus ovalis]MBU5669128.1 YicC family protein [Peptoniphilus ovalis]
MISMTGYGLAEQRDENFYFKVEMKSVNNRYLDLNIRLPKTLFYLEEDIKNIIKEKIKRGKVDVFVTFENLNSKDLEINIDYELLQKYIYISEDLDSKYNIKNDLTFSKIINIEDIFKPEKSEIDQDLVKEKLSEVVKAARDNLFEMRVFEGEKIKKDLSNKLKDIKDIIAAVEKRAAISIKENETRLRERVEEYLNSNEIEESRILTEIAIMLDKLSIDEEITRLKIHLHNFNDIINSKEIMGRKLDFLIQEINREVNTIGSKSNDIEISSYVVELKSEIEKIREQVQNLE